MGSVTIRETSQVGEAYSSIEYEFSDAQDYLAWDEIRRDSLKAAVKNFVGGFDFSEETPADNVTEIKVTKKKDKLH